MAATVPQRGAPGLWSITERGRGGLASLCGNPMGMERFVSELRARRELCAGVREFSFVRVDGAPLRFVPGQHIGLCLPSASAGQTSLGCYYSLSCPPTDDGSFALCVRNDGGHGAQYLFARDAGDAVRFSRPEGRFVLVQSPDDTSRDLLLVATGTGIAPFHAMLDELEARLAAGQRVQLLYGARYADELLYDDAWRSLAARHHSFVYTPTLSDPDARPGDRWRTGRVTAHLAAVALASSEHTLVLLCGVPAMVERARELLVSAGLADELIRTE